MFLYFLKNRGRNVSFIFWSLMFPLVLMICFKLAFGNLSTAETIDTKTVAIVNCSNDESYVTNFNELIQSLTEEGTNGDGALLKLEEYASEEAVNQALMNDELDFAFKINDNNIEVLLPRVHTETALAVSKSIADSYMANYELIKTAFEKNPLAAMEIINNLGESLDFVDAKQSDFVDESPNPYIWYYYSSLVMGILFNAMNGVEMLEYIKADCGTKATRVSVSPSRKWKLIASAYGACLVIALIVNSIQLLVMKYYMNIPIGSNPLKLALFIVSCNLFALAFGVVCGCFIGGSIESRANKITAIIMTSVFLSGEMVAQLPGYIERLCPIVNDINPATVMNMAFFRFAYSTGDFDFYLNMIKIIALAIICLAISVVILRREKYAAV